MKKEMLLLSTLATGAGPFARKHGFGLEITEYCTATNLELNRKSVDSVVNNKVWGVRQIAFHAPFNELFPCAIDPKARDLARNRYAQAMAMARSFLTKTLICHSGYAPFFYYDNWFVEQSTEFWREFVKKVPAGMVLCLENVLETRPEPLLQLLEAVNDPKLRICLDVGHVNAYSKVPLMTWLETLVPWIHHFHLHNNNGEADTHCDLNKGTIDMEQFLRQAERLCPNATYTLELEDPRPSVQWLMDTGILE